MTPGDAMRTGVDAFTETRNVACASTVEMPMLNLQLGRAVLQALEMPGDSRAATILRLRLIAADAAPTQIECPFSGANDVDFDRPGHGFWVCDWCGSLNEYEEDE